MAFCRNCGADVVGRFCAKCGTPAEETGSSTPPPPPPNPAAGTPMPENLACALCYVPLLGGIVFLVLEPYNRNKTIRFHAFQALFLFGACVVLSFAAAIFSDVSWRLGYIYRRALDLAEAIVYLYVAFQAFNSKKVVLPFIGPLAEKQA